MSSEITRKELKQDKFAVEVAHSVDFLTAHRKQVTQYGSVVVIVALIAAGAYYYRNSQSATRQKALGEAIELTSAQVSTTPSPNGATTFPTDAAKADAVTKAFTKVSADYAGDDEGYIAEYFLAGEAVSKNNSADARKKYQDVADHADANYASLAKLALAQLDFAENKSSDAETLLRGLIASPTDMVSKEQATITLAKGIGDSKPEEARKLLTGLTGEGPEVMSVITAALGQLPQK